MDVDLIPTPNTDKHYSNRVLVGHGKDIVHAENLERRLQLMRTALENCVRMMKQTQHLVTGKIVGDIHFLTVIEIGELRLTEDNGN